MAEKQPSWTQRLARAIAPVVRLDGWMNVLTGIGTRADPRQAACVAPVKPLTDAELTDAFHGSWVAHRIVTALVDDSLRSGWEYEAEELGIEMARWNANRVLHELAVWSRVFGSAFILLGTTDTDLEQPLALAPGKLTYLRVFDRRQLQVASRYADPTNPKFQDPEKYHLFPLAEDGSAMLQSAQLTVHETRLIRLDGTLTSLDMRRRNKGWPLSVLQRPWEVLRDEDQSWASIGLALRDMSTAVYAIKDFIQQLTGDGPEILTARMSLIEQARSAAHAVVVDKDGEDFRHEGATNLTGIDGITKAYGQRLAAAADMPLSRLLGQQPGGLNATGESETRGWYDRCAAYRVHNLEPVVKSLSMAIAINAGLVDQLVKPELGDTSSEYDREDADVLAEQIDIEWCPLWQESPMEEALTEKAENEAWKVRIDSGELSGLTVAQHRVLEVPLDELVKKAVKDAEEAKAKLAANPPADPNAPKPPPQAGSVPTGQGSGTVPNNG